MILFLRNGKQNHKLKPNANLFSHSKVKSTLPQLGVPCHHAVFRKRSCRYFQHLSRHSTGIFFFFFCMVIASFLLYVHLFPLPNPSLFSSLICVILRCSCFTHDCVQSTSSSFFFLRVTRAKKLIKWCQHSTRYFRYIQPS